MAGHYGERRSRSVHPSRELPTERIWYYDLSDLKVGKKSPLTLAHFEGFFQLLPSRGGSERSWTVERAEAERRRLDLKAVNPHARSIVDARTPEELLELIDAKGREVADAVARLRALLAAPASMDRDG